jgi:diguanylate cyclase (GGDEF)-like protein
MKSTRARFRPEIEDGGITAAAALRTWRYVAQTLSPVIGPRGVDALYNRSLHKNCPEFPWLRAAQERTPKNCALASLQRVLSRQPSSVASAATTAMLDTVRTCLADLVGEGLSEALLQDAADIGDVDDQELQSGVAKGLDRVHQVQLARVSERLLLAALRADEAADAARSRLSELTHASQHDPLTDTPNRALFLDRLQSAIAMARRRSSRLAVLFIDLDDFKQLNDTLGHAVGDGALRLVAQRLVAVVRESDSVSRYGGDEFLVLLAEVTQASDAALIGRKIVSAIATPASIEGHRVQMSASLGISVYPDDGDDPATLISRADAAMYAAKRAAPGTIAAAGTGNRGGAQRSRNRTDRRASQWRNRPVADASRRRATR